MKRNISCVLASLLGWTLVVSAADAESASLTTKAASDNRRPATTNLPAVPSPAVAIGHQPLKPGARESVVSRPFAVAIPPSYSTRHPQITLDAVRRMSQSNQVPHQVLKPG